MNKILVGKEIEGESYYTHDFVEMLSKQNTDLKQENKRLHSIIKEVREYIENEVERYEGTIYVEVTDKEYVRPYKELLEILDKENI